MSRPQRPQVQARLPFPPWVLLGALLVVTLVAYRGVTANGFVLDDQHTVVHNPSLRSFASVGDWLRSPHAASGIQNQTNYRPVLVAMYAADRALWGDRPAGFHATNLVIHLGVVALVWLLARRLWGHEVAALGAAAVVALHPINAEAVNYVTARSSSLMTALILAAIWASEKGWETTNRWWTVLAYLLGVAALGTKEAAVALPLLLIVWERARRADSWSVALRRSVPWWFLVAGFLVVRTWVMWGQTHPGLLGPGATWGQNALFAIKIYLASFGTWVWPSGLAIDHGWPIRIGNQEALGLVVCAGLAVAATVWLTRVLGRPGWCLVWFWAALLPVGGLGFTSRFMLYQDHRVYAAGIGLAWLVGYALAMVVGRARSVARFALTAVVLGGIGLAVVVAAQRTTVWADSASVWNEVLSRYPDSVMAHNVTGLRALEAGRLDEARESFERAVRLMPGFLEGHTNMGIVLARLEDWDRAAAAFEFALTLNPGYAEARVNLGKIYESTGRPDLAFDTYERVLSDDPRQRAALERTAFLLERQHHLEEAAARYRRILDLDPDDREVLASLDRVLGRRGAEEAGGP